MYSVSDETRKPIFEGVQGENEAREIQFDISTWVEELGEGVCTATAKRPTDTTPYPVTVTRSGNVVTWKPNSTDTSIEGIGAFQLAFSINDVVAKTRIWNTKVAPSLVGAGDPPDPYDDWLQGLRDIAAETLINAQNAEQSAEDAAQSAAESLANQYGAFIVKSASGDIASFNDGGADVPMKSVKVAIVPKQSGSGDPSPINERPISGWTDADAHVSGKNIAVNNKGDATIYGVTFSVQADGSVKVSGTATASTLYTFSSNYKTATEIGLKAGEQYRVSGGKSTSLRFGTQCRYGSNVLDTGSGVSFTASETEQYNIAIYIPTGATVNDTVYPMVRPASADATYEPAKPITTTPVPLGQTVYGGEVDVVSGVLKVTHAMVDMGTLSYSFAALSNNRKSFTHTFTDIRRSVNGDDKVDAYASMYTASTYNGTWANGNMSYNIANNSNSILFINNAYSDAASFQTAMTGQTLVYPLATPTTVQLTPTQVATLLGTNNVWADCGDIAVEYRADPTLAYAELQALILENL